MLLLKEQVAFNYATTDFNTDMFNIIIVNIIKFWGRKLSQLILVGLLIMQAKLF